MSFDLLIQPVDYDVSGSSGIGKPIYSQETSQVKVQFVRQYVVNERRSIEAGHEVHDEQIVLLKRAYKDTNVVANLATPADKRIYAREWQIFEKGERGDLGTPIDRLYGILPRQVAQLMAFNITTVEALLAAEQYVIDSIENGEGERLKALAQVFLNTRNNIQDQASAILEVVTYKNRSTELEEENRILLAEIEKLRSQSKTSKKKVQ